MCSMCVSPKNATGREIPNRRSVGPVPNIKIMQCIADPATGKGVGEPLLLSSPFLFPLSSHTPPKPPFRPLRDTVPAILPATLRKNAQFPLTILCGQELSSISMEPQACPRLEKQVRIRTIGAMPPRYSWSWLRNLSIQSHTVALRHLGS